MIRKKSYGAAAKAGGNGENRPHPTVMGVPCLLTKKMSWIHLRIVILLAACLLFAGAYRQYPLFNGNQNTYFTNGLASAGLGHLSSDWFAQQTDPFPVFSALVTLIYSHGSCWMFYGVHGILAAVYVLSLYVIADRAFNGVSWALSSSLFFAVITFLHSPWIGDLFTGNMFTNRLPALWRVIPLLQSVSELSTNGLASQYILGPYLQPSAFGVLLIASISLFVCRRELAAVVCAVCAATLHPTYILHAALLTGAYITVLLSERKVRRALTMGGLASLLILPIVLYVLIFLHPTSSSVLSYAQAILVEKRIPHHANASVLFARSAYEQLGIILGGLACAYRCKRLLTVLVFCVTGSIVLTCVQILSGSQSLALLFPWRVSTWLVPVSMALVVGLLSVTTANIIHVVPGLRTRWGVGSFVVLASIALLVGASILGVSETVTEACAHQDQASTISYAKMHSSPNKTYLVPLEFERFRLGAGVPIFVDWKSHPYRDIELVEWYKRVELAKAFYEAKDSDTASAALVQVQKHAHITHVVVGRGGTNLYLHTKMQLVYEGQDALVYELMEDDEFGQLTTTPVIR